MDESVAFRVALARYSLPLIIESPEQTGAIGTGTWIQFRGRELILTAGHVIAQGIVDGVVKKGWPVGIPERGDIQCEICSIEAIAAWTSDDKDDLDLGILDITGTPLLRAMQEAGFWTPAPITFKTPPSPGEFLLLGYPERLNLINTGDPELHGKYLMLRSTKTFEGELPYDATAKLDSSFHGFVDISGCADNKKLQGISGAAVWKIATEGICFIEDRVWVGVQTRTQSGSYIRYTNFSSVLNFLNVVALMQAW